MFGLLGDPVSHSPAEAMYSAAFRFLGVDARFERMRVAAGEPERVERAMRRLASRGGGNVTLPHKQTAAVVLEQQSQAVVRCGACNCFWLDGAGRLAGDNTDVGGFLAFVAELQGLELRRSRVLLLGAGGAARAVAVACAAANAASVDVLNRTPARATELTGGLPRGSTAFRVADATEVEGQRFDLVVNATSLGLSASDPLPLNLDVVLAGHVIDLVYGSGGTRWTRHAASVGVPAWDGVGMLVHQAALSLRCWFPEIEASLPLRRTLREAAEEWLG